MSGPAGDHASETVENTGDDDLLGFAVCAAAEIDFRAQVLQTYWLTSTPPVSISHLAGRLRSQFRVENGLMRVGGFQSHRSSIYAILQPESGWEVIAIFDGGGAPPQRTLTRILQQQLPLVLPRILPCRTTSDPASPLAVPTPEAARDLTDAVQQYAEKQADGPQNSDSPYSPIVVALELEQVQGKLCFEIGQQSVESQFADWAVVLLQQPSQCPAYICHWSGHSGRHLLADSEGDISLATELETCELTARQLHRFKLVCCANSGRWISRALAVASATTLDFFCPQHVTLCRQCSLATPQNKLHCGRCSACQNLQSLSAADPATSLECKWLFEQFAADNPQWIPNQLQRFQYYTNNRFHWFGFRHESLRHVVVLDPAAQVVTHRVKQAWQWNWRDYQPPPS